MSHSNPGRGSRHVMLSSVSLKKLDENNMPCGMASGCIVRYAGKLILLTVSHATREGRWAIELDFEPSKGVLVCPLGGMTFMKRGNIATGAFKDVDFSFVVLPEEVAPLHLVFDPETLALTERIPKLILESELNDLPTEDAEYGFYGLAHPQLIDGLYLFQQERFVSGMKYVGREDDLYKFRPPSSCVVDERYKGCSGAPIVDEKGNVPALLVGGVESSNTFFGIALVDYKVPIDVECGLV